MTAEQRIILDLYRWGLKVISIEPEAREYKYRVLQAAEDYLRSEAIVQTPATH